MPAILIRHARPSDLDALMDIEDAAFPGDRLSRRAMRHALSCATQAVLVAEFQGAVAGDAIVGFRRGSTLARLTSLAVHPRCLGQGLGRALLSAAENTCRGRGCGGLHLEVRADNANAIRIYEAAGYQLFGRYDDYYDDGVSALRYRRPLAPSG